MAPDFQLCLAPKSHYAYIHVPYPPAHAEIIYLGDKLISFGY